MTETTDPKPGALAELFLYNQERHLPKAFSIQSASLSRWDFSSFYNVPWKWPEGVVKPIGTVLDRRIEEVDKEEQPIEDIPIIEKVSFGGKLHVTEPEGRTGYRGRLFWASAGDLIYSKIRAKQGSLAVVPESVPRLAVSTEYPVYGIDEEQVVPKYIELVLRASFFKPLLAGVAHGSSTKTRIGPEQFEEVEIPIPPLEVQADIVQQWEDARGEARVMFIEAKRAEVEVAEAVYDALGTTTPALDVEMPKVMAVQSAEFDRWTFFYIARKQAGLIGFQNSSYPIRTLGEMGAETANGKSISPTTKATPYRVLKLSALRPAGLDTSEAKPVPTDEATAERFSVHAGDLLLCRSNAFEYVAKSAVVDETDPTLIFPDIMIRVLLPDGLRPRYAREVIETPLGRSYFQTQARRAAGAMWKIGAEDIASFPIPVPPVDVQDEIITAVDERRARAAELRERARRRLDEAREEIEELILGPE